jgi:hypothetical protein
MNLAEQESSYYQRIESAFIEKKVVAVWIIIIMVFCTSTSSAQDKNIVFEQKALDYFADSIIGKKVPFQKSVVF